VYNDSAGRGEGGEEGKERGELGGTEGGGGVTLRRGAGGLGKWMRESLPEVQGLSKVLENDVCKLRVQVAQVCGVTLKD
jgi:hypothetical protein